MLNEEKYSEDRDITFEIINKCTQCLLKEILGKKVNDINNLYLNVCCGMLQQFMNFCIEKENTKSFIIAVAKNLKKSADAYGELQCKEEKK